MPLPLQASLRGGLLVQHRPRVSSSGAGSLRLVRGAPLRAAADSRSTASEASATVERCLELFSASNLDGIVEFLPDTVVDRALERRRNKVLTTPFRDLSFRELLDLSLQGDFHLDAYAQRGLVNAPPKAARMLSSLKVSGDEFLQRYAITAASGEQMVVTFRMQLEDSLVFYRGVHFKKEWFLRGITGEPVAAELPTEPAPEWGPESVVQAQLEAFRENDLPTVYKFASPHSQLLSGSYEKFVGMLANAVYRPLGGHRSATVLQAVQMAPDKACIVVEVAADLSVVDSSIPRRAVYAFVLRLEDSRSPSRPSCWLTESLTPFSTRMYNI